MAKVKISEFSSTPGNNTDIDGINLSEGCAPSGINDAIRELMSQLKDFQTGAAGDSFNGPVGSTTPAAGAFTTLLASGAVTLSGGTANGVPYLNGSKVLTTGSALVFDGTNLGVGTPSPTSASGYSFITLQDSGANNGALFESKSGSVSLRSGASGVNSWGSIGTYSSHPLLFVTNSNERARIDSSGNLGLGVTPSAWSSGGNLQLPTLTFAGNDYSIGSNYYQNSGYKYVGTGKAAKYSFFDGQHLWYTAPSGTAGNAISFTQAMTLDASGNWQIGVTSNVGSARAHIAAASGEISRFSTPNGTTGYLVVGRPDATVEGVQLGYNSNNGECTLAAVAAAHTIVFRRGGIAGTENGRFDGSGNLLVGTTTSNPIGSNVSGVVSSTTGNVSASRDAAPALDLNRYTSDGTIARFYRSATQVGSIGVTTTTTTYNTSSDYRLKDDIQPMTGALAKVAALKPCTYKWKADGSDGEGFIAHELAEVCPAAVTGKKDGMRVEQYEISPAVPATFDDEGSELTPSIEAVMGEREVPDYQGIDVSFLVGTLTAAIQELKAEFDVYKAEHP